MKVKPAFFFSLLILTVVFLLYPRTTYSYTFPIPELGNCQNQKECHLYCEISTNNAACWSYRVYRTAVLGEESAEQKLSELGFSFPIAELGSCANLAECKTYCQDPVNQTTCQAYSQNTRAVVSRLLLEKAVTELGCSTAQECRTFCAEDSNKSLCASFGNRWKIRNKAKNMVLNLATSQLGCADYEECKAFCEKSLNKEACRNFAVNAGLKFRSTVNEKIGCTTNEGCRKLCAENPDQCPGYPKLSSPVLGTFKRAIPTFNP
jgi:hypothetical protein